MKNTKQADAPVNPTQKQIKIADNMPGAEYANAMQVNHNRDEFQMMFLSIMGMSGKVSGKIMSNPGHFKRMVAAMQDNLKKYEDQFGEIKTADAPIGKEIGFKG
ncbi:MAG: DUF3467 domain-containing protein [Patescibacteria group bacterium]|nr:DUF3467 domain-containing protein [Patescibacteria group bacterium]